VPVNSEFEELLYKKGLGFTVILGSGFHRQALGGNSVLSNWEKLLKDQDPNLNLTGFFSIDYEQLIIQRTGKGQHQKLKDKPASEIEKRISDEICREIKSAQDEALKLNKHCYPTSIFNPERVTDIISLNFDTTAELLCCNVAGVKKAIPKVIEFESKNNDNFQTCYWEVFFNNKSSIRFWYPHGSIHDKSKNILGIREYAKRFEYIERLRKYSKSKNKTLSWYHQLTHQPVLILGADMKKDEWDLWFAFVNRERNFAKSENKVFKHPIFQMRECECQLDYRNQWFQTLFTGMKFDEQWKELEELLKRK
jgi:hypothetical protein